MNTVPACALYLHVHRSSVYERGQYVRALQHCVRGVFGEMQEAEVQRVARYLQHSSTAAEVRVRCCTGEAAVLLYDGPHSLYHARYFFCNAEVATRSIIILITVE